MRLALLAAAALASSCLATFSTHDAVVAPGESHGAAESIFRHAVFFTLLPATLAVDVVTAPFQYVYVITHAR